MFEVPKFAPNQSPDQKVRETIEHIDGGKYTSGKSTPAKNQPHTKAEVVQAYLNAHPDISLEERQKCEQEIERARSSTESATDRQKDLTPSDEDLQGNNEIQGDYGQADNSSLGDDRIRYVEDLQDLGDFTPEMQGNYGQKESADPDVVDSLEDSSSAEPRGASNEETQDSTDSQSPDLQGDYGQDGMASESTLQKIS